MSALPLVTAGPERLFRVDQRHGEGDVLRGSMPVGPWVVEPDGTARVGAFGVLIDNLLGYAINVHRPRGHCSVSTEITLDVLAGPSDRSVCAEASCVEVTGRAGYAVCEVVDDAGAVVARGSQRGWYIPVDEFGPVSDLDDVPPPCAGNLWDLLGLRTRSDDVSPSLELVVSDALVNPLHNLHGGISLCVSELAAHTAIAVDAGSELTTASIHVAYTRAVPVGSVIRFCPVAVHRSRSLGVVDVTGVVGGRTCTSARIVAQTQTQTL